MNYIAYNPIVKTLCKFQPLLPLATSYYWVKIHDEASTDSVFNFYCFIAVS